MNRRDALQAMLAIPGVASIGKIEPKTDEVFVIHITESTADAVDNVVKQWHDAFEYFGIKPIPHVLVFPAGYSLQVAKLPKG